jgi:tryptophan synthase beta chain
MKASSGMGQTRLLFDSIITHIVPPSQAVASDRDSRDNDLLYPSELTMFQELFEYEAGREGFFGEFGGAYIPEILHETFAELRQAFDEARRDPSFWEEYVALMSSYSCRPTPVTFSENLTRLCGGAQIYFKREDLNHTGAHKANNVMGQGLLVRRMGKQRVIAETGAGQHGVATATMAAKLGLSCTIYMGAEDVERQRPNVFWMEQLGAEVIPVEDGTRTLKDAINAALRDWADSMQDTHYVLGTVCGPHPFPLMVTWFQSIIGQEARRQMLEAAGRLPDKVFACVGGGSNASGVFSGFLDDAEVELVGVEAGGLGLASHQHAARIAGGQGQVGVAQGYKTYFMQDREGQMQDTHSISAGLDYIGVGPILAWLHGRGRIRFEAATDQEVIEAFRTTVKNEGLIPALESSHAIARALQEARGAGRDAIFLINLSGRGDKDIFTIADALADAGWRDFLRHKVRQYDEQNG